ncbi:hypothetical protein P3X46_019071 [Hevea brasiliensis]|uniref:TPX2 C-terminal domain-containing protein n=1 Tax=Hevea brasiliensis TaxID=3981 RepID=A0ABQ9LSP1_HEVBR|nr:uncharacterized protein LOC110668264 [Hevea brasiliensis]KAJ9171017.1 hypothetical protein P3X46_019071 [Hevea brasiliensis]
MSILHYPDEINAPDLQVWNNAAFDNGESEDSTGIKSSWWTQSLESSCSKENLSPVFEKSPVSLKSSVSSIPIKPLNSNGIIANAQGNTLKLVSKPGMVSKIVILEEERNRDERKIDKEIEDIEKEIKRLSSRLEALRLEKAERSLKMEKKGRIVPAKFMEPKQTVKIEEPLLSSAKSTKINRRGLSLGPSEILSGAKSRLLGKQEMTPVSTQNRRKSCFWKLEEIDELKATKERGKSLSVSPRSRKTVSKIQAPKLAATTVGSKKSVKKEDGFLALIQPKTLFKDGEKSVPNKKPVKPGRFVPSRYNQFAMNQSNGNLTSSEARKRSLPDSDKEDGNKRRASRGNGVNQRIDSTKVKKKWEIPSEVVIYNSDVVVEESEPSVAVMGDVLPKIKTSRFVNETPRDSGAAKRVADLVGRKSFFSADEEETTVDSVCQALSFEEEDVKFSPS